MADLDDFFAKKDKKKSRAVKKFTASDLMTSAKYQSEDVAAAAPTPSSAQTKKVPVEKKKEEVADSDSNETVTAAAPVRAVRPAEATEEEEWGEFEQEKERDYSGLKIQKLQIQDYEEEEEEEEDEHELNEEGELVKREPTGPWNKITSQPTTTAPSKVKEVVVETPNTAGGVYIPPSMRNKTASSAGGSSSAGSRTKSGKKDKGAPDLNNEDYFPTLSAAVKIEQESIKLKKFEQTERGFTEAKPSRSHSNRAVAQPGEGGPRFALGNKFATLSNDD